MARTTMTMTDAVIERSMTLIEKLEQLSDEYLNQYTAYGDNVDLNCSSAVDDAIAIVKQHTCEWDDCSGASYVPCCDFIFCYNQEYTQPDFIFCPYCGGKIQPPSEVQDD